MSALGYAAYPGYRFKSPQGAALAVARLVRSMADRGLIGRSFDKAARGYQIRRAGVQALEKAQQHTPTPNP